MWRRVPIQVQPVPEKTPCEGGIGPKPMRRREVRKLSATKRRIRFPKPLGAAEVREAGIDAHPGASSDQERIGRADPRSRSPKPGFKV